jgi:hypothetical protein
MDFSFEQYSDKPDTTCIPDVYHMWYHVSYTFDYTMDYIFSYIGFSPKPYVVLGFYVYSPFPSGMIY